MRTLTILQIRSREQRFRKNCVGALEKLQREVRRVRVVIDALKAEMIKDAKP